MAAIRDVSALFEEARAAAGKGERDILRGLAQEIEASLQLSGHDPATLPSSIYTTEFLKNLRKFRLFGELATLGGVLVALGRKEPEIRKLHAQGLIDSGHISPAIDVLEKLADDSRRDFAAQPAGSDVDQNTAWQYSDILAVLGRAHKQLYMNFNCRGPTAPCTRILSQAIDRYYQAYQAAPPSNRDYPGVNLLALLARAKNDGITLQNAPHPDKIADEVIAVAKPKQEIGNDPWAMASLAEVYLYQQRWEDAAIMYNRYIYHPKVDAFALAGTIRQLSEVWGLEAGTKDAGPIVLALKAKLFQLPGGSCEFTAGERACISGKSFDDFGNLPQRVLTEPAGAGLERKVLGDSRVIQWSRSLVKILMCGESVAGILDSRNPSRAFTVGTGFLIDGADICPELTGERFLLTNSHVVSANRINALGSFASALHPRSAQINFAAEASDGRRASYGCEIVWESPQNELDAALLRLDPAPDQITPLKLAPMDFALSAELQSKSTRPPNEIVVIGHMEGGPLAVSYEREKRGTLVDIGNKTPTCNSHIYLHYRTTTEPGNSGSPLIDFESVSVIGLHRAGPAKDQQGIPRLNGVAGILPANEGVHIDSIRREIKSAIAKGAIPIRRAAAQPVSPDPVIKEQTVVSAASIVQIAAQTIEAADTPVTVPRITYAQLIQRLSDPNTRKEDIAPYLLHDRQQSGPYSPAIRVNPKTVDMGDNPETVSNLLKPANRVCAFVRQTNCRTRISEGYEGLRFVSEGDSWFEYPFLLDDVIDQLSKDYAIYCIAAAGDELKNMASQENLDKQIFPALSEVGADGLLFSGGGNDIVGEVLLKCLKQNNGQARASDYLTPEFDKQLTLVENQYKYAFDAVLRQKPALKIFTHGYDLPTPSPKGQWLGTFFEQQNITDVELQRAIVQHMLSKVTGMHEGLERRYKDRVFFVNCSGVVKTPALWHDELHPTNDGYALVADKFREAIKRAFPDLKPRRSRPAAASLSTQVKETFPAH